jgi:hypothetical protein
MWHCRRSFVPHVADHFLYLFPGEQRSWLMLNFVQQIGILVRSTTVGKGQIKRP